MNNLTLCYFSIFYIHIEILILLCVIFVLHPQVSGDAHR